MHQYPVGAAPARQVFDIEVIMTEQYIALIINDSPNVSWLIQADEAEVKARAAEWAERNPGQGIIVIVKAESIVGSID